MEKEALLAVAPAHGLRTRDASQRSQCSRSSLLLLTSFKEERDRGKSCKLTNVGRLKCHADDILQGSWDAGFACGRDGETTCPQNLLYSMSGKKRFDDGLEGIEYPVVLSSFSYPMSISRGYRRYEIHADFQDEGSVCGLV